MLIFFCFVEMKRVRVFGPLPGGRCVFFITSEFQVVVISIVSGSKTSCSYYVTVGCCEMSDKYLALARVCLLVIIVRE